MTIEQDIQKFYIDQLQKHKIDFVRIKNSTFKSKGGSPYTHAFNDHFAAHKFFPDIIFCHNKQVYLREFKEKGKNPSWQLMQEKRMDYWREHGSCNIGFIYTLEGAISDFNTILGVKHLTQDEKEQLTIEDL
jgi:hypothetical protein